MTAPSLKLSQLTLHLNNQCLLQVDAQINAGEILTVMGPSGSGKSSLLAAIGGFLAPEFRLEGSITLAGQGIDHLPPESRGVGLLFQDPLLFPHMSIANNLIFAMPAKTANKQQKASEALSQLGLSGYEGRDPDTLSGGQRTRVALQRLLLSKPKAVLLDEPFSNLDTALRQDVRQFIFSTLADAGLPTIMVTHDKADAVAAGGHILQLSTR